MAVAKDSRASTISHDASQPIYDSAPGLAWESNGAKRRMISHEVHSSYHETPTGNLTPGTQFADNPLEWILPSASLNGEMSSQVSLTKLSLLQILDY